MNKTMLSRINRLEKKTGSGSGLKRYFAAIMDDIASKGMDLPTSATPPVPPETRAANDNAFAQLSEEDFGVLSEIVKQLTVV